MFARALAIQVSWQLAVSGVRTQSGEREAHFRRSNQVSRARVRHHFIVCVETCEQHLEVLVGQLRRGPQLVEGQVLGAFLTY